MIAGSDTETTWRAIAATALFRRFGAWNNTACCTAPLPGSHVVEIALTVGGVCKAETVCVGAVARRCGSGSTGPKARGKPRGLVQLADGTHGGLGKSMSIHKCGTSGTSCLGSTFSRYVRSGRLSKRSGNTWGALFALRGDGTSSSCAL